MKAYIEQIEVGMGLFGQNFDYLDISNGKQYLWIFSIFNGYEQLGRFKVPKGHGFKEGEWVEVVIINNCIISVDKIKGVL